MTPLFKEKTVIELLATEINNNFTQQQKEKLHFLIGTSDIVDYAGIKLLAKNIKNYLVDELYAIKHGQVLNILAKSYGFSNHHSMTASFEQQIKYYEGTTDLFKIFQARKELFNFFNEKNITFEIKYFSDTNFYLKYILKDRDILISEDRYEAYNYYKRRKSEEYQIKSAFNKLVRKYNIKLNENTVPLIKISNKKGIDVDNFRDVVVQKYRDFFNPQWIKGGDRPGNVQPIVDIKWCFLTYENVFLESGLLHVGSYSNDLKGTEIVKSFLTFLIRYGEIEDFIFVEALLKQEENLPTINKNSLTKNLLLRKYEKFKFTEDFMKQYVKFHTRSLNSILQSMKFVISLTQKDMQLLNQYADDVKDVIPYYNFMNNLSKILMRSCINNIHEKDRYSKIEKTLYLDFLHYKDESKIIEVKSINKSTDIILVSRLAQLVEIVCNRIEELVKKNQLELDNTMDLEQ